MQRIHFRDSRSVDLRTGQPESGHYRIRFSDVPGPRHWDAKPGMLLCVGGAFGFPSDTHFGALFHVRSTAEASS
jgi:hypothetical protein